MLSHLCGVVFIGMLIAGITSAQTVRPVSGVVAVSSGTVLIAYTDESGQEIGRSAGIGDPIYLNDEIRTGPDTSLQILLRDQTVFSIGPDAAIVFDEFVYDPANEDQAALSATVTKGVFKFISGKIANNKPEAMKIKLPNATASIRGTTVAGRVRPDGTSDVVLLSGSMSIQADSGAEPVDIFQSGWGTSVSTQARWRKRSWFPMICSMIFSPLLRLISPHRNRQAKVPAAGSRPVMIRIVVIRTVTGRIIRPAALPSPPKPWRQSRMWSCS